MSSSGNQLVPPAGRDLVKLWRGAPATREPSLASASAWWCRFLGAMTPSYDRSSVIYLLMSSALRDVDSTRHWKVPLIYLPLFSLLSSSWFFFIVSPVSPKLIKHPASERERGVRTNRASHDALCSHGAVFVLATIRCDAIMAATFCGRQSLCHVRGAAIQRMLFMR